MQQGARKAEEGGALDRDFFRLFVEGVKDYAILMLDPQGHITSWNKGAEQIKGYTATEIIGKHFSCLYPKADIESAKPERELEAALRDGRVEDEGWRTRKDGSVFWANVVITPILDRQGTLLGFCNIARDLTERRRRDIEEILRLTVSALRSATRSDAAVFLLFERVGKATSGYAIDFPESKGLLVAKLFSATEDSDSLTAKVLRLGNPVSFSAGEASWPNPPLGEAFSSESLKSGCALPFYSGDDFQGLVCVLSFREAAYSDREIVLLTEIAHEMAVTLENALRYHHYLESWKEIHLENELREIDGEAIVGKSAGMKDVLDLVETVAKTDSTVLILGETGTGKELIAATIHKTSLRRDRAFIRTNCAAIPAGLLESELFGHEKGAFTGATERIIGRFELANKGTLFLDEIGDLPLELQSKLLRVLQEQEIERLGSTRTIKVDFRLVAATNRDLSQMMHSGQFRSDLFFRLNAFPIKVPPLRDRKEDIAPLVRHFVQRFAKRMDKRIDRISTQELDDLAGYDWPGNIRELQNIVERSVILARDATLHLATPNQSPNLVTEDIAPRSKTLADAEREYILQALRQTEGVIGGSNGAASLLGLKRTTLLYKMRRLGISCSRK
jgi:formate hydrogenlyase transcriptional activator